MKRFGMAILCAVLALPVADVAAHSDPILLRELPLLFADDSGVESRDTLVRSVHPARRRDEPVLVADRPWEVDRVYMATVHRDPDSGHFRMWYLARVPPEEEDTVSDVAEGLETKLLYAYSKDGLEWEKPSLEQSVVRGSSHNNVLDFLGGGGGEAGVLVDYFEEDPNRRYKLLIHNSAGYSLGYSANGIEWEEMPGNPVFGHGDTAKIAQNPVTGEYLAYYKMPAEVNGFPRRVVWLSRSHDFTTWSEPELVFVPDAVDDEWTSGPKERMEIYLMSVFPHAAGYMGFPAMFFHMPQELDGAKTAGGGERSKAGGAVTATGPMDIQLVTSPDGVNWRRSYPRIAVVPRGQPGTYDGGSIYNVASEPVHVGDETWVYYTAINTGHGAPVPPKKVTIGRAEWRRHGYASLDAGPEGGRLKTKPVKFAQPRLCVNADASLGMLRVALLELDGRPINGFGLEDCEGLKGDDIAWTPSWQGASTVPTDRPVRLLIEMHNTRLYSVECRSTEDTR